MPYFGGEGGDEGVKFRLGTSITAVGNWLYDYEILIAPPENGQNLTTQNGPVWGAWVESFNYYENALPSGLTSLTFNDLAGVKGEFGPGGMAALTTLSAPNLVFVGGLFDPNTCASLTTFNFPNLTAIGGTFQPNSLGALTTLSIPALKYINGNFAPSSMASLTTLTLTNLVSVNGAFSIVGLSALSTLSCPALQIVGIASGQSLNLNATGAGLTAISFPALIRCGNGFDCHTGNGNIATATLGSAGTTKLINGNVNFGGQKMNQASVDQVLHTLASLDGTGGTTSWGTGKTVTLNGGTNSTPSAAGLTDKATIVGRGGTVLNN